MADDKETEPWRDFDGGGVARAKAQGGGQQAEVSVSLLQIVLQTGKRYRSKYLITSIYQWVA
jgi:hypothetical protein